MNESTLALEQSFDTDGWTEHLQIVENTLYAVQYEPNGILTIDLESNNLGFHPTPSNKRITGIAKLENAQLLVGTEQGLYTFKANNFTQIIDQVNCYRIQFSENSKTCYWLEDGLQSYNFDSEVQEQIVANTSWENAYGLGIDTDRGLALVCDAKNYVEKGEVQIYNLMDGRLLKIVPSGVIPQHVMVLEK